LRKHTSHSVLEVLERPKREGASMGQQRMFAGLAWSQKGKVTRRERFLAEMDAVIPWAELVALIEPYYAKLGRGRQLWITRSVQPRIASAYPE